MTPVCRGLAAIISALIWAAPPAEASHAHSDPYRGLGAWVDRYDPDAWRRPERTVRSLARKRVNTIFLRTGNYALADALPPRRALGHFVDTAHREHLQIVAWYAPDLCHLRRDKRRSLAAIRFRSARGQRFDSFGLDIESACVRSPRRRNQRLLRLSRSLRGAVGRNYPLAAIGPSPRGMQLRAEAYWPRFPFAALHRHYDAFVLMTYFTYRATGTESVRAFTAKDIALLRAAVRDRDVAIHSIGGEAQRATVADVRGFTAAVREANVHGVSSMTRPERRHKCGRASTEFSHYPPRGSRRRARAARRLFRNECST